MIVPVLICFGLLAILLIASPGKYDEWGTVGWLIILLAIGLLIWGMIPEAIGFKEDIYR